MTLPAPAALSGSCWPPLAARRTCRWAALRRATPPRPVEVTSETLSVDQATGRGLHRQRRRGQGDLRLQAGEVEVRYDEEGGEIARLLATGGVTLATAHEAAEAQEADYDLAAGTLTLTGEVLLTQGPSAISADRMVVDLEAGTALMEGNVRTVLQRGESDRRDAPEGAPPAPG
jgi:lipopolysaccharide export system protein LptA